MNRFRLAVVALLLLVSMSQATDARAAESGLRAFRSCGEIVKYGRASAGEQWYSAASYGGFGSGFNPRTPLKKRSKYSIVDDSIQEGTATSGEPAPFSTTNNQEIGVDEPDAVKTDGRRLFVAAGSKLRAYDVSADVPIELGTLDLGRSGGQLLLRGDRMLVLSNHGSWADRTRLMELDVSDPRAMRVLRIVSVLGTGVEARLTGSTVRVVLNTAEHTPEALLYLRERSAKRKRLKRELGLSSFLPSLTLDDRTTGRRSTRRLVDCAAVKRPAEPRGLDVVSVLSFDLDRGLGEIQTTSLMSSTETIYASPTSLYIASTREAPQTRRDIDRGATTDVHRFDASVAGRTDYVASGSVPGYVLNRYSMSEWGGDLRIATTESPLWLEEAERLKSESRMTVLRPEGSTLRTVGSVGGLGKGERIYAARFMGPVAYLVTFRETDPLYTLDLSDPAAPKVVGELKINGYSAYLHPIGDGLLLGVGQDADAKGVTLGTQVSLFDVSSPASPVRLAQQRLGNGGSPVEYDPHSFLWWAPLGLAVIPVSGFDATETYYDTYQSAAVVSASRAGLAKTGELIHGPLWDQALIRRSVVIGDRLLTLSDFGLGSSHLPGGALSTYSPFPADPTLNDYVG